MTKDEIKYTDRVDQLARHAIDGNGIENSGGRVIGIDWDEALKDAQQLCSDELAVRTWSFSQSLFILQHTKRADTYLDNFDVELCQPLHELTAEELLLEMARAALTADVVAQLDVERVCAEDVDGDYNFTDSRHGA